MVNYLNERMPFATISQCKMEMKAFPTAPKFETMDLGRKAPAPGLQVDDLQSRRESNPARSSQRAPQRPSK